MNLSISAIKQVANRGFAKSLLTVRHYSPEILTVVGIAGVVTSAVMMARATLKLEDTVVKGELRLQNLREIADNTDADPAEVKKERALVYFLNGVDLVKLYGPSATLMIGSIVCIVSSNGISRRRNVALVAAYKTIETQFSKYRERVSEEIGEEKEKDLYYGLKNEEIEDSKGKKQIVKTVNDPNSLSQYWRVFDEGNIYYEPFADRNRFFITQVQNHLNDKLRVFGFVFLNEAYEALGFERTRAGSVVGWTTDGSGDGFIDFGLLEARSTRFVNGDERSVILDFNVDGVITDKLRD